MSVRDQVNGYSNHIYSNPPDVGLLYLCFYFLRKHSKYLCLNFAGGLNSEIGGNKKMLFSHSIPLSVRVGLVLVTYK